MMRKCFLYFRRYPLTIVCLVIIWVLSLVPFFPETPLDDVQFIDKWTHLVMYGGTCGVLWTEYLRSHTVFNGAKLLLLAWAAPIAMSGVLELLQEYATTTRSGEWGDLLANATGVSLGAVYGVLMLLLRRR